MPDSDNWNSVLQWLAGAGAFIGAMLAAIFGSRAARRRAPDDDDSELSRLRAEHIALEVRAVRADFELVVQSLKDSNAIRFKEVCDQVADIFERLRLIEQDVAVLNDRQGRGNKR